MHNILIIGANGFIGRALCDQLSTDNKVVGVDLTGPPDGALNIAWEQADQPATRCEALRAGLTDRDSAVAILEKHSPDVVIHCAGIAHQKIGAVDSVTYMQINSEATENLAKDAAKTNPPADNDQNTLPISAQGTFG